MASQSAGVSAGLWDQLDAYGAGKEVGVGRNIPRTTDLLIRVYLGGRRGTHYETFCAAYESLRLFEQHVNVEYLDCSEIRRAHPHWLHAKFLVDWLEASDIYFVLCQCPYLGFYGIWDVEECLLEFKRLNPHVGYPDDFGDPVFQVSPYDSTSYFLLRSTLLLLRPCPYSPLPPLFSLSLVLLSLPPLHAKQGDKFRYLAAVSDITMPTLKLPLHPFKGQQPSTYVDNVFARNMFKSAEAFMAETAAHSDGKNYWLKVHVLFPLSPFY